MKPLSYNDSKSLAECYKTATSDIKGRLDGHYQHEGVKWMLSRELQNETCKGGILADDMGLGKTMQAITTMKGNPLPTLIVSLVGLVGQWKDALIEFGGYKPIIVTCSFMGILPTQGNDNEMVVLTSYSCFQKSKGETPPCLFAKEWGRVILDEGHVIRNANTKLHKELMRVTSNIKWVLTGTPIQNGKKDLLALVKWLGVKSQSDTTLDDIRETFVLRRTQQEEGEKNARLQLPPLETEVVCLEFIHSFERDIYNEVERHFEELISMDNNSYNTAIQGITRCRQLCTHPKLYMDGCTKEKKPSKKRAKHGQVVAMDLCYDNNITNEFESSKVTYLISDVETNVISKKGKCLIFCSWTLEMRIIQQALKRRTISSIIFDGTLSRDNKENVLYNFKNSHIPVLILQINCGCTGLNLQCASRVYIMSPHWNPCIELQAIGRAYRKGQNNKVTCVRLVVKNTIEERCIDVQVRKTGVIMETLLDTSMEAKLGSYKETSVTKDTEVEELKPEQTFSQYLDEILFG
jgi:SNF2 family DNA or RNA helicase